MLCCQLNKLSWEVPEVSTTAVSSYHLPRHQSLPRFPSVPPEITRWSHLPTCPRTPQLAQGSSSESSLSGGKHLLLEMLKPRILLLPPPYKLASIYPPHLRRPSVTRYYCPNSRCPHSRRKIQSYNLRSSVSNPHSMPHPTRRTAGRPPTCGL